MSVRQVAFWVASDRVGRLWEQESVVGEVLAGIVVTDSRRGDYFSGRGFPCRRLCQAKVGILQGSEFFLPKRCSQFQSHVPEGRQKRK